MLKIKYIISILALIYLSGCALDRAALDHLPTISKAGKFPYGGWIVAEYEMQDQYSALATASGELIAYQDYKLYILDSLQLHVIPSTAVNNATLYIYKTQPGLFAAFGILFTLPSIIGAIAFPEYAGEFLLLGIVPFVTGTIFTVREATIKRNQLIYPLENSLNEFVKFARFPQGIPEGMDVGQLKLPD